ncbi:hypothetical protein JTE90_009802 [Oedothorax gibbosus]|uniref:Tight junction protein ZO-1 n=1 Tax=Oedothorax gibbosus TaxID=931172 RepID=A0AAV6USM2_9ARAC|nr:hypothetical protein JTE90_009802 [Oedothorax gibbosus]
MPSVTNLTSNKGLSPVSNSPVPNYDDTPTIEEFWGNNNPNNSVFPNQNVYVSSPTRAKLADKNNLARSQTNNWNHNLMDNNHNPDHNLNGAQMNSITNRLEDIYIPPRPPLPQDERNDNYDHGFRRSASPPDPRFISFQKDGTVGIRLTGGNEVGIFVTGVQQGTPAYLQGLQSGDKILKVNDVDMRGFTKEEAVSLLVNIHDQINLIVQFRKDEYEEVINNQKGDSFYIRTHFSHESTGKGELSFRKGEVFHVVDTLYNGKPGSWLVYRLGRNGQEIQRGIVPNSARAKDLAQSQRPSSNKKEKEEGESGRGSFFRRRARRSKSLCRDHWEDVLLADAVTRFPPYERVILKQPGFIRPVVIFGPLTDVVKDRLLKDYPQCYASPQSDNHLEEEQCNLKSPGIIRLSSIRDVIDKGKHAILDITPSAVDRLNYAQFYPVVVYMHAENKNVIKELRTKWSKATYKSSRKLLEHSAKLEKLWSHIFTANISLSTGDSWYKKLQETIDRQQKQPLWVSEAKPDEAITDDFLFPMSSRLSYHSSPESDLDISMDNRTSSFRADTTNTTDDRRLVKSSSDPSIVGPEELANDAKKFAKYSAYTMGRNSHTQETTMPIQSLLKNDNDMMTVPARVLPVEQDDYPSHTPTKSNTVSSFTPHQRARLDPYATLTPSERIASQLNGELKNMYETGPRSLKQRPPIIDRSNKPLPLFDQGQDMPDMNMNVAHDYINTLENFDAMNPIPDRTMYNEDSSYLIEKPMSNGYQYKSASSLSNSHDRNQNSLPRTTSNSGLPYQSMTLDRAKFSQMKNRHDVKPPPPPPPVKSAKTRLSDGRPVPPPKPVQLQSKQWQQQQPQADAPLHPDSLYVANGQQTNFHSRSYPTSPLKPPPPPKRKEAAYYNKQYGEGQYTDQDLGHSYSQDNVFPYSNANRAYSNVMFHKNNGVIGSPPSVSPPLPPSPPISLDISSRGSAFELYRKTDGQTDANQVNQRRRTVDECNDHAVISSVRGVFGSTGGALCCRETGVSLHIPPGAISEGETHDIYFKVCHDTNMLPPLDKDKGETLLSPLVMCGPPGLQFRVPIELRLPHCASLSPDRWSFALKASDAHNGEWQNLESRDGLTSSRIENDYVSVLVDHF